MSRSGAPVLRCDCCKRRRSLNSLVPVDTDFGLLVVCGDRDGCQHLYMPIRRAS